MTREICKCCFQLNKIGFSVPDNVWEQSIPEQFRNSVLCLTCFTRFADEQLIDWDNNIEFYPVSLKTILEKTVCITMKEINKNI